MKNQHFKLWIFMWMQLVIALIPAVLLSERFDHSMIVFWLVYLLVVAFGTYAIFRIHCMNTNQSEAAKKYKEDMVLKMDMLEKDMLAKWTPSDGVGGSRFKHRWLLKSLINRHTSLLNSLINKQARAYAALDKFHQMQIEHPDPESIEKVNKMIAIIKKEIGNRQDMMMWNRLMWCPLKLILLNKMLLKRSSTAFFSNLLLIRWLKILAR